MTRVPDPSSTKLSRRTVLQRGLTMFGVASMPGVLAACDIPLLSSSSEPMEFPVESPEEALQRLLEGNQRYASGKTKPINESAERRVKVAERQRPFAAILSCVDSRVPPELLFDRGLGDLFVSRTAGHVVDSAVMGSLEYGAYELEIPLLLVLGHKKCGAVKATMEAVESGGKAEGSIAFLVEALRPAVVGDKPKALALKEEVGVAPRESSPEAPAELANNVELNTGDATSAETIAETATSESPSEEALAEESVSEEVASEETVAEEVASEETVAEEGAVEEAVVDEGDGTETVDHLTEAIKRNITMTVKQVSASPIIAERIRKDRLRVVGALYDLETGLVELTDNIPKQFLPADAEADSEA